jgi:rRNA maturation RNase YbeY
MIHIENEQTVAVDLKKLKKDTQIILQELNYKGYDIGILLVTPEVMQQYNKDYREKDKPTDILSFAYHTDLKAGERIVPTCSEDKALGDIILCPTYIHDDLERWEMSFRERMEVLLVHGICHLLGYDHIEDADYEVMKKEEERLLSQLRKQKGGA